MMLTVRFDEIHPSALSVRPQIRLAAISSWAKIGTYAYQIRAELIGIGRSAWGLSISMSDAPFTISEVFMAPKKSQPIDWEALLDGIFRGKAILEYGTSRD